jgi:hypothetical protein
MPPEALREHLRRIAPFGWKSGGIASVLAKGLIPFAAETADRMSKIEFVSHLALSLDPAYQIPARIKAAKIARKVNEEYHGGTPVRNSLSIRSAISRYWKHRRQNLAGVKYNL